MKRNIAVYIEDILESIIKIGEYTKVGMGSTIFDGVNVGNNTIIGAGSLVTKSVPDNVVAYGVPARVIRDNYK